MIRLAQLSNLNSKQKLLHLQSQLQYMPYSESTGILLLHFFITSSQIFGDKINLYQIPKTAQRTGEIHFDKAYIFI